VPDFEPASWDFRVGGLVEEKLDLDWEQFRALPRREVTSDFHCVTRWSTFDNRWEGVLASELLARCRPLPAATHVMLLGSAQGRRYGYSANLPLADLDRQDVVFAFGRNGEAIPPDHGGPLRLVVPHLYAWKSVKWARGLVLMDSDRPGYWEGHGYHHRGDPFREERFEG
jgi:DMSO/TMAO reductase YedYZ molybdopterin-dependent catalytic subunit